MKKHLAWLAVPVAAMLIACGGTSDDKSATKAAAPGKPAVTKTLMTAHGTGIKNTAKFTTGKDWTVAWTYDCAKFGNKGNFIATVTDSGGGIGDIAANEIGAKGSDSSPIYNDSGEHYLSINSECDWTVKVTG